MAIAPLQLPTPITNTPINWSGLDKVGDALMMRGLMNRLGQMPDPTVSPGAPLNTIGQPQAAAPSDAITPQQTALLTTAAQKYGVDPNYLLKAAQIEGTTQNPSSSAQGLGQFIDSTAKQYGVRRGDDASAADAFARFTLDNKAALTKALGRDPTPGELYLAHQQGADGAIRLLSNPNAQATSLVGQAAVVNNGGSPAQTGGDFSSRWTGRFSGGGQAPTALAFNGDNPPLPSAPPSGQPQPAPGGAQPAQVSQASPQQVAQPQSGPAAIAQPWMTEAAAQRYEQAAAARYKQSMMASMLNPALSNSIRAQADAYMKQAQIIRQSLAKNSETTPEMKNAVDPNVVGFERTKASIATAGKNAELTPEMKNAAASGQPSPLGFENQKDIQTKDVDAFNKEYIPIQKVAQTAVTGAQYAKMGKSLTLQPGFYSGPFHEGVQTYQQFKSMFGNPSAATPMEALDKVANNMLIESVRAMGGSGVGRVLQSEVNAMKSTIASKGITPQTNRALLELADRVYTVQQGLAQAVQGIPRRAGQSYQDLQAASLKYLQAHPILNDAERANPSLLGAPDAPPQSAQWSVPQRQQWARGLGLQSGDPIRFNGQLVTVP